MPEDLETDWADWALTQVDAIAKPAHAVNKVCDLLITALP